MNQPPGTSSIDALLQIVRACWPEAADVRLVAAGAARGRDADDRVVLAAVPDAATARLLVPVQRGAASTAVSRYSAALTVAEVAQRVAVSGAIRALGPVMLRDRVLIEAPGGDHLAGVVAGIVGRPVSLSLGIGTARANRKPVLGAFDEHGTAVAYVKLGDTEVARAHVAAEACALEQLGTRGWSVVRPPQLLGQLEWRGMHVVVMSALRAVPWQGRDGRWPIPDDAMSEICDRFDGGVVPLALTPWWARVTSGAAQLRDRVQRDRLLAALDRIEAHHGAVEVQVGAWHGDFTPWNMSRSGQRLLLWDWERFETGVPVGLDRYHYAVNVLSHERSFGVPTVIEGLRRGATGDAPVDGAVALAYLVALTLRYLLGAQEPGGEVVAERANIALDVLDELSRQLSPRLLEHPRT